jgi:beta-aspartyl-dipeptidase (metallo-type)
MFTLIRGGEVYAPKHLGVQALLLVGDRIARVGDVDADALAALGIPLEVVEARDRMVVPGFLDPHQHLLGGGGEQGFASRMPPVPLADIVMAGITTVVGCLGTDTTTRHPSALLGRVRQLRAAGLSAYLYTGGFPVPPRTLTGSVERDLVLIPEIVGVGELAIADVRSSQPRVDELARIVAQAMVAGRMAGKAGLVHFHVGPGRERLGLLNRLLDEHEIEPGQLYPTHINRDEALLRAGIELARRGSYVDLDTVGDGFADWLRRYRAGGGPPDRLTVSSDAHTPNGRPAKLHAAFVAALQDLGLSPEEALPPFTENVASVLRLSSKGRLEVGADADLILLERDTLAVCDVFAGGRRLVRDGQPTLEKAGP